MHPWGDAEPTALHGVFDFTSWDPEPAGSHPAGQSAWGVRDLVGRLRAVGERADLDQVFARSEALYARFFAWYSASASGESTSPSVGCVGATSAAAATP